MEIKGCVAVITGGGNGIGEAVSKYFARQGAKVVVVDMAQGNIDRVVGEIAREPGDQRMRCLFRCGLNCTSPWRDWHRTAT